MDGKANKELYVQTDWTAATFRLLLKMEQTSSGYCS